MLRLPHLGRTQLVLGVLASLLVLAMLIEADREAAAETILGLVVALLAVAGWLAWITRAHIRRRAGRAREDSIGAALDRISPTTLVLDHAGVVLDVSPATAEMLGYRPDELIGKALDSIADPDDRADIMEVAGPAEGDQRSRA